MHPFEQNRKTAQPGVKPSLRVLLKEGWRLASRNRSFVSPDGEEIPLKGVLPAWARVISTTPALAEADAEGMSDEERYLARHVQVVLPSVTDAEAAAQLGVDAMKEREWSAEECDQRRQRALDENDGDRLSPGYNLGPCWSDEELALLGMAPDEEIAAMIGRTVQAVRIVRNRNGIGTACDRRQRKDG